MDAYGPNLRFSYIENDASHDYHRNGSGGKFQLSI